jgi:hypothetical protein
VDTQSVNADGVTRNPRLALTSQKSTGPVRSVGSFDPPRRRSCDQARGGAVSRGAWTTSNDGDRLAASGRARFEPDIGRRFVPRHTRPIRVTPTAASSIGCQDCGCLEPASSGDGSEQRQ